MCVDARGERRTTSAWFFSRALISDASRRPNAARLRLPPTPARGTAIPRHTATRATGFVTRSGITAIAKDRSSQDRQLAEGRRKVRCQCFDGVLHQPEPGDQMTAAYLSPAPRQYGSIMGVRSYASPQPPPSQLPPARCTAAPSGRAACGRWRQSKPCRNGPALSAAKGARGKDPRPGPSLAVRIGAPPPLPAPLARRHIAAFAVPTRWLRAHGGVRLHWHAPRESTPTTRRAPSRRATGALRCA